MYISDNSGHHKASLALETAFKYECSDIETLNVNAFNYTNPVIEKIINSTYMSVIKRKPEFWGYLYDNPAILKQAQNIRKIIHKHNTEKLKKLFESFNPDACICTQAFPCGMVADYKKTFNAGFSLFGILTDFSPHSYWIFDNVDKYFIPASEAGEKLIKNGVAEDKICVSGIPIDPRFKSPIEKPMVLKKYGLRSDLPIILLMGGSQGIGPLKEVYASLNHMQQQIQIIVVSGINKKIFRWFKRREKSSKQKLLSIPYAENVAELMEISDILISKPGGITLSEALVKGLPLCVIKPIPGQEQMNTDYLLKHNLALSLRNPAQCGIVIEELITNRSKLEQLSKKAKEFSKPDSAITVVKKIMEHIT